MCLKQALKLPDRPLGTLWTSRPYGPRLPGEERGLGSASELSPPDPERELEVDARRATVLITIVDSSDRHWPGGGDEVVKDLHHCGWGLDVRVVPDSGEHLKPATRHGVVSGVTVGERDDPVLFTPNQQDR